jgi:uncharacterized membrane protein YgdD (TMEM256/DUF423 family)
VTTLPPRRLQAIAALLLALATVVGALSAHALRHVLPPDRFEVLETAVRYQFIHALGLLVLGFIAERSGTAALHRAGLLLLAGILLFSGSLYLLLCGAPRVFGVVTPVGGILLVAGWLWAALALWRAPARS